MNMKCLLVLALLIWPVLPSLAALDDTTPPRLVSLTIAPPLVDPATGSQVVVLTVRLQDDLSGIRASTPTSPSRAGASAVFRSPVGDLTFPAVTVSFHAGLRVSGDEHDGVYTNALVLPRYAHAGSWTLIEFGISDAVGNRRQMTLPELRQSGFPTQFQFEGIDDREPPDILSATISPVVVDTSEANQPLTVTVHLRDDAAGLDRPLGPGSFTVSQINFASPSRAQHAATYFAADKRVDGDTHDGTYTNVVWLPRHSEPGRWSLDALILVDAVGNQRRIDLAGALDRGLTAEFTVGGIGDTEPPQIRRLDFTPRWVDPSERDQTVLVSAHLTDALSGLSNAVPGFTAWGYASVGFQSPSRLQFASAFFIPSMRASGTVFDGLFTNSMILPRYSETGVWTVQGFSIADAVGNVTALTLAEVEALGLPTRLAVGILPALTFQRQGDSLVLSWPAWASGFGLESRPDWDASGNWEPVVPTPLDVGEVLMVVVPQPAGRAFFRLVGPR